jgi:dipeptidyl aminopeptidase/acylaminoacyl peptidase
VKHWILCLLTLASALAGVSEGAQNGSVVSSACRVACPFTEGRDAVAKWRPQRRKTVTLEDLPILSEQAADIQLSADGTGLAVSQPRGISLLNVESGASIRELGPGAVPTWAPDGQSVVFYSNRSGTLQLWIWRSNWKNPRQLTQFSGGIDPDPTTRIAGTIRDSLPLSWSPDSRRIVFASRGTIGTRIDGSRGGVELPAGTSGPMPVVLTNSTPEGLTLAGIFVNPSATSGVAQTLDGWSMSYRPVRRGQRINSQLFVVDALNGVTRRVTDGNGSWFHPAWAPDGQHVACVAMTGDGISLSQDRSQIVILDLATGEFRQISMEPGLKYKPEWAPNGRSIAYLLSRNTISRPSVIVREGVAFDKAFPVPFIDRQILAYQWASNSTFLVRYRDGPSSPAGIVDIHTPGVADVVARDATLAQEITSVSGSKSGAVAWTQYDPRNLTTIHYLSPGKKKPHVIARLNPLSSNYDLPSATVITWRNAHGDVMQGSILLPPGYEPGRRYPVILDAYPMMTGSDWANPMMGNFAWASMGYVVFRPSGRAPHVWVNPWTTKAWSLSAKGASGWSRTVDDYMSGVDEIVRRGIAKQDRICLYGFSNGGGVVDYLVTETNRFRCAVTVSAAAIDWVRPALLSTHFDPIWVGMTIDDNTAEYVNLSSVFRLSRVNTPMLMANGDLEVSFLLDGIEMYNGLRRLGKTVTFVRYPDQGHGLAGAALSDFWNRELAFFASHLASE